MEVVNVTPGNPIKSETQRVAESSVKANTASETQMLPPIPQAQPSKDVPEINTGMADDEAAARARIESFMALPPDQRKAKLAVVLDRGIVHDRLAVDLPSNLHGEWVRDDPNEVDRMRTLGFWIDNKYATNRAIHGDGTSSNRVADTIFMVTLKENKEMIDAVRLERQLRSARNPRTAEDTEQFVKETAAGTGGIIPTFSESSQRTVNRDDVRAALARADAQTQVSR